MLRKKEGATNAYSVRSEAAIFKRYPLPTFSLYSRGFHGRRALVGPKLERREALKIVDRWIDDLGRGSAG